jgi:serine protease AprX
VRNRLVIIFLALLAIPCIGRSQQKYWIFFKDKGYTDNQKYILIETEKKNLSQRALSRRAKVLSEDDLIDEDDLPLFQPYLEKLNLLGIKTIVQSRWLNAISAKLTMDQINQIEKLVFISKIKPVSQHKRDFPPQPSIKFLAKPQVYKFDYGPSLDQNEMMRVPEVHDLGLEGSGVIVGMLDTGYDYKFHEAFSQLDVITEYDFINDDSTTQNEPDDNDVSSQHNHGTYTLSALGGFKEGQLIGPAFGASFLLAKTEDIRSETPVEEDYWVVGIEWLERMGADVVNSSLGYNDWYTYADMDGRTAVTTIAADKAVEKGVVLVNSMGNEGNSPWYHMIAPADGFNVISVGAVYNTGELVGFSSRGPTYDGRTKPDVVAMGSNVYSAEPSTTDGYRRVGGTSLSSPLTAGVAALVLQAHPYLSPFQVRDALRETANRAQNPDNEYGWGLVNAYEAIFYHGLFFNSMPEIFSNEQLGHLVTIKIFSKYELKTDSLFVYYAAPNEDFTELQLTPSQEQNEYQAWIPLKPAGTEIKFYFSAADISGDLKFHPHKAPGSFFSFFAFDSTITPVVPPEEFQLYQNYPNPFAGSTTIKYDIIVPASVTLIIYNIRGQQVRKLVDDEYHQQNPFPYQKLWDGRDDKERLVASGIYFYRLKSGKFSSTKRMVFLRGKSE